MKLLVIGAGMMGSAAAYDMACSPQVESVTLADNNRERVCEAADHVNRIARAAKVKAVTLDASDKHAAAELMKGHDGVLSAVPYFFNFGLAQAAVEVRCHFADLGGNNTVVRQEISLGEQAALRRVSLAPDCGLSPGMASILAGELMRRLGNRADALKIYVGGLPLNPKPPFNYQLVFSVEGLINEYVEPARVLRKGEIDVIEPLTEPEDFHMDGFPALVAFHTSGGTSTLPETFQGKVIECFEKTLRFPDHYRMLVQVKNLGLFSSQRMKINGAEVAPRAVTAKLFEEKFSGADPDICILRVEAHKSATITSFTIVDRYDEQTGMSAMMRTTAFPASIVLQMMVSGAISRRGIVLQEQDVPAEPFIAEMERRGIRIEGTVHSIGADMKKIAPVEIEAITR